MADLTPRQTQILNFIQEFIEENEIPPTRAEIARALGYKSANSAEEHLRALQRKEAIELIPGASRGIRLVDHQTESGTPVIGYVAAGSPLLAESHIERRVSLPTSLFAQLIDWSSGCVGPYVLNQASAWFKS